MKSISIFVGSNGSNLKLAKTIEKNLVDRGVEAKIVDLISLKLPVYSPEEEKNKIPTQTQELVPVMSKSDGFIFLAPEYNGGIPPVLVNFITWMSRSGEDWRECFAKKRTIIGTHSGSGGSNLFAIMRLQFAYIGMNVLANHIHTHYKKELNVDKLNSALDELLS